MKELYQNPKFSGAFTGRRAFYRSLKDEGKEVTHKKVKRYLESDDVYTLHKPVKRPKHYRRVYTKRIGYLYQADLIDVTKYSQENYGYKWMLLVIDTFSKYLWIFPMKNKRGESVTKALTNFLTYNTPEKFQTDQGVEFYNQFFKELVQKLGINHYSTFSPIKCAIAERAIRTLKTRLERVYSSRGSHRWIDVIDDIVRGYNNSYHSSIGMKPNQVNSDNESEVRDRLFPPITTKFRKDFKVGDSVRITRQKSAFQKGYEQTYSYQIYQIRRVQDTKPPTYLIKDFDSQPILGSFYKEEIQKVDKSDNIYPIERVINRRSTRNGTEYLVKFMGYPNSANTWIPQQDLFDI